MKNALRTLCVVIVVLSGGRPAAAATISGRVQVPGAHDNSNAVVYIDRIQGKAFTPSGTAIPLDQRDLTFVPHVLPILVGSRVSFPNTDIVRHNVFSPGPTQKFDLGMYPVNQTKYQVFNKPGVVTLLCNIHAEMSAYIVVTETPYFAVTDAQGNYTIPNVPSGRYVLKVWHERYQKPQTRDVEISGSDSTGINFDLRK